MMMETTSDNNIYFSAICCFVAIPSTIIQMSCFRYKKNSSYEGNIQTCNRGFSWCSMTVVFKKKTLSLFLGVCNELSLACWTIVGETLLLKSPKSDQCQISCKQCQLQE